MYGLSNASAGYFCVCEDCLQWIKWQGCWTFPRLVLGRKMCTSQPKKLIEFDYSYWFSSGFTFMTLNIYLRSRLNHQYTLLQYRLKKKQSLKLAGIHADDAVFKYIWYLDEMFTVIFFSNSINFSQSLMLDRSIFTKEEARVNRTLASIQTRRVVVGLGSLISQPHAELLWVSQPTGRIACNERGRIQRWQISIIPTGLSLPFTDQRRWSPYVDYIDIFRSDWTTVILSYCIILKNYKLLDSWE